MVRRGALLYTIGGGALFVLAIAGVVHSVRASVAHAAYRQLVKEGAATPVDEVLRRGDRIHRLYPYSYYLCERVATSAYERAQSTVDDAAAYREAAWTWCRRGVELNPYRRQLRSLEVTMTADESLPDAIALWEAYTDWDFWLRYNHARLAHLYAAAGDFERADIALRWASGSRYYAEAKAYVDKHRRAGEDLWELLP